MTTKLSVLVPVHNGETYLGKAIRSLLAQSLRELEVVVLDDGSIDKSARLARSFGDKRVRVYRREEHEGVAATRNHLLIAATSSTLDAARLCTTVANIRAGPAKRQARLPDVVHIY